MGRDNTITASGGGIAENVDLATAANTEAVSTLSGALAAIAPFTEAVEAINTAVNEIDGRKKTALDEIDARLLEKLGLTYGEDGVEALGIGGFWGSQLVAGLFAEGEESEGRGAGGLLGLLMGGMFASGEGEEGENPFQAMIAQAITNMLTVGEGEESPLQPLFAELDAHVKGAGDEEGKGGLFGELIAFVRGDKEAGTGGLFGELTAFVNGSEGKDNGLKGELRKVVYAKDGLIFQLEKRGNEILDAIQALWNRLFGIRDDFNPEQGDDPRV